jgi:uroporphyrinogen decarboxylase
MISKSENFMRVLLGEKPEWTPIECPAYPKFGQGAYQLVTYQGALPPQSGGYDLWGTLWRGGIGEELPYIIEYPLPSLENFPDFKFPNNEDTNLWNVVKDQVQVRDQVLSIGRQVSCLWERLYFLIGFDKALIALADKPEVVSAALSRIVEWQIDVGKKFIEIGVEAVRISDDYGSQKNLLMSPKTWREIIRPHLEKLVSFYQQAGLPVALHSCGNLKLIMDDLVDLEIAAFNIQTNTNDLAFFKQRYGNRFRLWGGVSTQSVLATGTPDEVCKAVVEIHDLFGRDGLLILEPDQIVALPEENLQVFWETASKLHSRER